MDTVSVAGVKLEELTQLLDSAFASASFSQRREFFERWHKESALLQARAEVTPGLVAEAYSVFQAFYRPDTTTIGQYIEEVLADSARRADYGTSNEEIEAAVRAETWPFPREVEYVVVQGWIRCRRQATDDDEGVCDKSDEYGDKGVDWGTVDSMAFYPDVQFFSKPVVYLTAKYQAVLNKFLGLPLRGKRTGETIKAVLARRDFLATEMMIHARHRFDGWHYLTFPQVGTIDFNAQMSMARVSYRDSWCTGGEVCYLKSGGKWVLYSQSGKWIE